VPSIRCEICSRCFYDRTHTNIQAINVSMTVTV
jgi:hypothetical protein